MATETTSTQVYLGTIGALAAALREIKDCYDAGTAAHDTACKALADADQPQRLASAFADLAAERDKAYRERAHLVAFLAACYPAVLAPATDTDDDGWSVVYVRTPAGQMSWHVAPGDLILFGHVPGGDEPQDGHTTEAKYERLTEMTARLSAGGGMAGLVASLAAAPRGQVRM